MKGLVAILAALLALTACNESKVAPLSSKTSPTASSCPTVYHDLSGRCISQVPDGIYGNSNTIGIRIGNGGAGISGLVGALAQAYLAEYKDDPGISSFSIAWYKTDSTVSLAWLKDGKSDVALTYDEALELQATEGPNAYASERTYIFNDHFYVVGPASNPAGLNGTEQMDIAFTKIMMNGCSKPDSAPACAVFMSRDDLSATNLKEKRVWTGLVPAETLMQTSWYVRHPSFPDVALKYANDQSYYTLTDKGTWLSNRGHTGNLRIFLDGTKPDQNLLLLPAHATIALHKARSSEYPKKFVDWMASPRGQAVIDNFGVSQYGEQLYSPVGPTK